MPEVQLASLAAEAREAIDSEDFVHAAAACRRALQRYPRWVEGYWLLGQILVESAYVAQARSCFEAVASAMPDDPRPYEGLAAAAEQDHDPATAVAGLVRAMEVGESSQNVREELHRLQAQAGVVSNEGFTNARVAHARLMAGQYEEADAAAERGLSEEPDRLDLLVVQSVARLSSGDRTGSQRVCQRLLDLSPDCLKALAIMRFLTPADKTATVAADLDALDPEGQTLVWLRNRMTALGYDADDLPSAPRLVRWQAESSDDGSGTATARPLDRLIPELEEVWPKWLQEAAQQAPEAPAQSVAPANVAPEAPPVAAGTPSFLGDVNALAREFEDAMKASASPPSGQPTEPAPAASESETSPDAPALWSAAPVEPAVAHEAGAAKERAPRGEAVAKAEATQANVEHPATDWTAWETPPAGPAEHEDLPVASAPPSTREPEAVETAPEAAFDQPAAFAAEPPPAPAPDAGGFGDWVLSLAPIGQEEAFADLGPQSAANPDAPAPWLPEAAEDVPTGLTASPPVRADEGPEAIGVDALRQAALAAGRAGDYWTAIARYGEALARLRAT